MATPKLLQAACAPSPFALAASAALSAWSGDVYDAVAALIFLLAKLLAVVWARRWCEDKLQSMGVADDSGFGALAQLMGRASARLRAAAIPSAALATMARPCRMASRAQHHRRWPPSAIASGIPGPEFVP